MVSWLMRMEGSSGKSKTSRLPISFGDQNSSSHSVTLAHSTGSSSLDGLGRLVHSRARWCDRQIRESSLPPLLFTSRVTVDGLRSIWLAIELIESPLLRPKEIASRSSIVSRPERGSQGSVSYTHLRAHETGRNLVCRLL